MAGRVRRAAALILAPVALTLGACSSSSDAPPPPVDRTVEVYEGIIRWAADEAPPPPDDEPDELPVIYVVTVDGDPLGADRQVEIINELKDEATVRMADRRDEAVDADADGQPVRDDGVLLLVGPVEPGSGPVDVRLTVYRDVRHEEPTQVTLRPRGEAWVVTDAVPVEPAGS